MARLNAEHRFELMGAVYGGTVILIAAGLMHTNPYAGLAVLAAGVALAAITYALWPQPAAPMAPVQRLDIDQATVDAEFAKLIPRMRTPRPMQRPSKDKDR